MEVKLEHQERLCICLIGLMQTLVVECSWDCVILTVIPEINPLHPQVFELHVDDMI